MQEQDGEVRTGRRPRAVMIGAVVILAAVCGYQQLQLAELRSDMDGSRSELARDLDGLGSRVDDVESSMPEEVDLTDVVAEAEDAAWKIEAVRLGLLDARESIDGLDRRIDSLEDCATAIALNRFPEVWCG